MLSSRDGLRCLLSAAALLSLLGGCALAPAAPATADEPIGTVPIQPMSPPDDSPAARAQYHVMAGELAAGRAQPKLAAQEFMSALELTPSAALAGRATELAIAAGDEPLALSAARRWQTLDSTSLEARETLVRLGMRAGNYDEVYVQCDRIVRDDAGGFDDGFHHVAILLSQEPGKGDEALRVMHHLVDNFSKVPGAWRAQSLLALRFGRYDDAEQSARQAIALQPSKESELMLVGALIRKGDVAQAEPLMENIVRNNPSAADVRLNFAQLLIDANQPAAARDQLERVLKAAPANADAHSMLGVLELNLRNFDAAQAQFEAAQRAPDHRMEAEYYLGRVAELRREPGVALGHYEKVTNGAQALDAVVRRAAMLGKLGRVDEAQSYLEQLRAQIPQLAGRFTLAEGDVLADANKLDRALALYDDALKSDPDDPDFLYARSIVRERANQIEPAEDDLRRIIKSNPDDSRALNALGYMLVVHSDRLDEAQGLIERALKITPEEPAALDSLGWLRYRQGHPQDALPLLQKAYATFPDAEVAAHLGEVLWALGEKTQAREIWTRAGHEDPDNLALRDTVKRFEQQ